MGAPRFRPAPYVNPDGFERRLRTRSLQQAGLDNPPPKLAQTAEFPPPGPSGSGPNVARHGTKTTAVESEDEQAFDVDDLRAWWQRGLSQRRTESPSRDRKLIAAAGALVGVAIVGSVLALKVAAPREPPVVPSANDIARAPENIASASADVSTTPSTGLSRAMPVVPTVDTQAVQSLASSPSAQSAEPRPAKTVSVRPDGTLTATQLPSVAGSNEASSSPEKPPAKSTPEGTSRVVATAHAPIPLPTKGPGKITARVVVATTEAAAPIVAADTPVPPLPIGTSTKPEEAGPAKALPMPESAIAPATPAQAANQSPSPLMRAVGDLFGVRSPAFATESTGWAVQLAASKSKGEAKRVLKRLNAKYGSALSRSRIVLHKALINGEAVYRLRVVGLSKSEAEALCATRKDDGGNCFIVK
jgi:SPOR domain